MNRLPANILLFLLLASIAFISSQQQNPIQQKYAFRQNCVDEHDKNLLSCTISSVDCSANLEKLFPPPPVNGAPTSSTGFPNEAHDLRIEPFAKATPRNRERLHQLLVDISWQTPPNNSTRALKGFLLEIEGENGRKHACFLFNVSATNWTAETVAASPRLHFATDSLFGFAQHYEIELYSLPERSVGTGASVHTRFTTPHNPNGHGSHQGGGDSSATPLVSPNCTKFSNQFASKWTAGFRHIYVHSAARILQVEFVGAPPQYCFEQYEVRLLDETGLELLHSGVVSVEEMQRNGSMALGTYNFSDLEYDKSYIPSVIPVERAADGRCLCPVFGTDPYDVKVVCSCVAADWKPVRMTRPDVVKLCPGCSANDSAIIMPPSEYKEATLEQHRNSGILWVMLLLFNGLFLLLIFLLVVAYLRCRLSPGLSRKDQFRRIRFVPAANGKPALGDAEAQKSSAMGGGPGRGCSSSPALAVRTNLALGTVSASSMSSTPLLVSGDEQFLTDRAPLLTVLIVYAHDCAEHERAVMALAELLREDFNVNVKLDRWDIAHIEHNLIDWLSASVVSADKVLIVNSAGAWERYRAKIGSQGRWVVERKEADPLDHLFLGHIDMALQHHSIVSVRFCHSHSDHTLPMLQGLLQYVVPDNLVPLMSALFGRNMRADERLAAQLLANNGHLLRMREAVQAMEALGQEQPTWLADSHHRRVHSRSICEQQQQQQMPSLVEEQLEEAAAAVTTTKFDELLAQPVEETPAVGVLVEESAIDKVEKAEGTDSIDQFANSLLTQKRGVVGAEKLDSGIFEWATGSDEDNSHEASGSNCREEITEERAELLEKADERNLQKRMMTEKTGFEENNDSGLMATTDSMMAEEQQQRRHQQQQQQSNNPNQLLAAS